MREEEIAREEETIKENFLLLDLNSLKKEQSNLKRKLMKARMNLMSGLYFYEKELRVYEIS